MGREIKFRAWDKANNKMLYGKNLWGDKGKLFLRLDGEIEAASCGSIVTTNYVLMQYTGLKDKNGVEIYEGDIVRHMYHGVFKVIFINGAFYCSPIGNIAAPKYLHEFYEWLEAIGNVHENLELLEGGSD